jgi:hypothetical protein
MSRTNGGLTVTETNQAYFAKVADCLVQEEMNRLFANFKSGRHSFFSMGGWCALPYARRI